MEVTYRKFNESDETQVNMLALSAFEQYANEYEDWNGFKEKISLMSQLAVSSDLIVAEQHNKIVGAIAYVGPRKSKSDFFQPEWAIIRMLVVSPEARNNGIGRTLINMCEILAKKDKAKVLALHSSEIMEAALSLYLKTGFTFYSKAPDIHGVKYGVHTKVISA